MQICCTKKLLDEMGAVPSGEPEEKDLFCWSAHIIAINRRKTVVVVNDSNRFGFILYGLKAKDFKNLDELILQGITNCLRDEKVKDEIISQYIQTAGNLVFTKTRGAKYVSRLNRACEQVSVLSDAIEPDSIIQISAGRSLNNDLVRIEKGSDFEHPYDLLIRDFEQFSEQVIECEGVELMARLNLGGNTAWRRIVTPIDITFWHLHKILQVAFEWKGYHLYRFYIIDPDGKIILNVISESEEVYENNQECKTLLDKEVVISDYLKKGCRIVYRYDYGDDWEHEITVQKIIPGYDKNYPVCLMGEKNSPPEDVGGIQGYEEFLKIMKDPKHSEYENTRLWAQGQIYRDFNINFVNARLKYILRSSY